MILKLVKASKRLIVEALKRPKLEADLTRFNGATLQRFSAFRP